MCLCVPFHVCVCVYCCCVVFVVLLCVLCDVVVVGGVSFVVMCVSVSPF